jgi:hypothetical protein
MGAKTMTQAYSNPKRASDPHALPDIEIFWADGTTRDNDGEWMPRGWYWWTCFPGCLPDSEPCGPHATEAEALAEAQEHADDYDDSEE